MIKKNTLCYSPWIAWQIQPTLEIVYINNLKTKEFIKFEDVGKDIWIKIGEKKTVESIVAELISEYDAPKNIIIQDVEEFINDLLEKGVLING